MYSRTFWSAQEKIESSEEIPTVKVVKQLNYQTSVTKYARHVWTESDFIHDKHCLLVLPFPLSEPNSEEIGLSKLVGECQKGKLASFEIL